LFCIQRKSRPATSRIWQHRQHWGNIDANH
jgi:hypothetical protein